MYTTIEDTTYDYMDKLIETTLSSLNTSEVS